MRRWMVFLHIYVWKLYLGSPFPSYLLCYKFVLVVGGLSQSRPFTQLLGGKKEDQHNKVMEEANKYNLVVCAGVR